MSDGTWTDRFEIDTEPVPDDEKYGGGLDHDDNTRSHSESQCDDASSSVQESDSGTESETETTFEEWVSSRFEIDTEPVPDDEKYGGGLDHEHDHDDNTRSHSESQCDDADEIAESETFPEQGDETTFEEWVSSRFEIDSEPVPDDEKYGDGVAFDEQWQRQTHSVLHGDEDNNTKDDTTDEAKLPPETPTWIDDARGLIRDDLRPGADDIDDLQFRCEAHIENLARGVFNIVALPNDSAWFQLLERHDLVLTDGEFQTLPVERETGVSGKQVWHWRNCNGLQLKVDGDVQEREHTFISYLTIRGPEQAVTSFTEDLLTLAEWIKRELRAPSPIAVANAAQESGERVPDDERLVDRDRTADVVRRLPRGDAE
jgi:hypothetical protein